MMRTLVILVWVGCIGCSSDSDNNSTVNNQNNTDDTGINNDGGETESGYAVCDLEDRIGTFTVALDEAGFSTIQGQAANGVNPAEISIVDVSSEKCVLLIPPLLFCDPSCTGGTTCNRDGICIDLPGNQNAGTVTVSGLTTEVSMEARPPVNFYSFTGDLPHPAFSAGSEVSLSAAGGDLSAFQITAIGINELAGTPDTVSIDVGTGAEVTWATEASDAGVRIELEMNIANHGGTPGRIICVVEDTGSFTIPPDLVDTLLGNGFSGFPSVRIARQGAGTATIDVGCVDLRLKSERLIPIEIPGLVSCSLPEDCPDGQTCLPDLSCG